MFAGIVLQVAFAGYGSFNGARKADDGSLTADAYTDGFGLHSAFGYLVVLLGLVALVLAFLARPGRRGLVSAGVLAGLLVLQVVLAWIGYAVPGIGALHPVNALLLFGLSGSIAYRQWRGGHVAVDSAVTV